MGLICYIAYFFSSFFSSSLGSGPGVGNLNVSGLSIRPRCQLVPEWIYPLQQIPMESKYQSYGKLLSMPIFHANTLSQL